MRYAILSDIHGNLEAFTQVLDVCRRESIDQYLCLGDIIGYGANPRECLALSIKNKAVSILGNHEWAVLGKSDLSFLNPAAKTAVLWTRAQLTKADLDAVAAMKFTYENDDLQMAHGTLDAPEDFCYLTLPYQANASFQSMTRPVGFIGHTHVPQVYVLKGRELKQEPGNQVALMPVCKYLINPGSVGQPRDRNPMASFAIFDTGTRKVEIRRVDYDIKTAQEKIRRAGLPDPLATRLAAGW